VVAIPLSCAVLGLACLFYEPSATFGIFLLMIAFFFVCCAAAVFLHEAGHFLCAVALGLRVFHVRIGWGPTLIETTRFGVDFEIKVFPWMGIVFVGYPSTYFFRLRGFLVVLAGPATNAALAVALWWLLGDPSHRPGKVETGLRIVGNGFVLLNGILSLGALLPYNEKIPEGRLPSDGLQLLTLPFTSRESIRQTHAYYFTREGDACRKNNQPERAAEWYQRGLNHYPDHWLNTFGLGCALLGLKQPAVARQLFLALYARPELGPVARAYVVDAVATADLYLLVEHTASLGETNPSPGEARAALFDTPRASELLEEAERYSEEAVANVRLLPPPSRLSLLATKGCVLIERGKFPEGVALLEAVLNSLDDPPHQAFVGGYLALAAARQGQDKEARSYLESARLLDPSCVVLEAVTRELEFRPSS
jgi:hypothetical protein